MRIENFLSDSIFDLPIKQPPKQDFKQFLFRQLDIFIQKLEETQISESSFDTLEHYPIARILQRQLHFIGKIKETVNAYYNGKPSEAYAHLSEGLVNPNKDFNEVLHFKTYLPKENFYRIRIHKENYPIPVNSFFHIPFEKRGLVKTQRFSIPGFPSLYIGSSLYVCWEEMNRPNINDFQAVRLSLTSSLKVLDLSPPPNVNTISSERRYHYLMIWPLVMACSVQIRNHKDTFKPEYIVPQLLLQWVREKEDIDGIAYQTTHIDFRNNISKGDFFNLVLPVKDNRARGLCSHLKSKFVMTNATSIQLSQCSNSGRHYTLLQSELESLNARAHKIEVIPGKSSFYGLSVLGELERTLNYSEEQPIGIEQDELAD
ncbi:RES domain-containing protein [Mucilaginibacter ginkgonis]|uniref:RES domain-containing protein n=1 Tax=Mucilaginibacter ginkgonis TaxID=2682091 RepID=A0A6I4HW92_9SPHI|nr:RES domain-containing protein [Mucilaginibacter ginkgonis]QQL51210.1 RES domain-containing protein [Mucilaginibacter ginkgonis]